ncbi:MAG: hypothetical protein ABXS91_06845 [Sulfurimonas sp.]
MIILVLTQKGFHEVMKLKESANLKIWVNPRILSKEEITDYQNRGIEIADCAYDIDVNSEDQVNSALKMLSQNHPNEVVFVER